MTYEYEKQGFELGNGIRYLPDFWLPSLRMWVEIKAELDSGDNNKPYGYFSHPVLELMRRFRSSQSWPVACIFGQPGNHRVWFFAWDMSHSSAGEYEEDDASWCISHGQVALNVHIVSSDRDIYADNLNGPKLDSFTYARDYGYKVEPIENALIHARQASFEHGERPHIR